MKCYYMHRYQRMHGGRCNSVSRRFWMHSVDRVPGITIIISNGEAAATKCTCSETIIFFIYEYSESFTRALGNMFGIWMCLWLAWFKSTSTCGKNKSPKEKSALLVRTPAGRWDFSYSSAHTSPFPLPLARALSFSNNSVCQCASVRNKSH